MADVSGDSSIPELIHTGSDLNARKQNTLKDSNTDAAVEIMNEQMDNSNGIDLDNTVNINENHLSSTEKENFNQNSINVIPMEEISLRVSNPEESKSEDIDSDTDPDTICGIGNFRPKWMQPWATPKVYLALHCIIGVVSGSYYAYRIGVMSTLEKRFAFKSKTTGTIMIFDEITPVFFGALVGYYGGKMHRPRILGLGVFVSVMCCFISALPYFMYGSSKHIGSLDALIKNGTDLEQCDGSVRADDCDADDRPPTVMAVLMWMVAGILKGFGNLAYHSIGLSYLDDNAKKKDSPMYFAIAFVLRLFGPLLGFLMSSVCLKFYENPFDDPGYGPDDPRWIGAWWVGFLIEGFLLLIIIVPISMFPRRLPGIPKSVLESKETDTKANFKDLLVCLKRLFLNPLFLAIMLNEIISVYGTVGHHVMMPKYMEHQFRLTASDASLYSGVPAIAAIMVAVTLGGYLIWKFRPALKLILGAMIISEIIGALGFVALMIPKCEKLQMANFGFNDEGLILDGSCNANCNCSTKIFTPVCGADGSTLYFSPCYAGCEQNINKTFFNCSCVPDSVHQEDYATEGFCMSENCWQQALAYVIAWPTLQFIVSILRVMQVLMLLRCTHPKDKSLTLGIYEAFTCILGFTPYLIIFGAMVDSVCLVWESSCEETGNCWFYDTDKFSNILHGMSAGFSGLSVLTMWLIYYLRGRFYDLYDEDGDLYTEDKKKKDTNDAGEIKPMNE